MTDSAAVPDGIRLAELIEELPLSRGSVFELLKVLGISTGSGPGPNNKGRVAWVSADSADPSPFLARLEAAERAVASGLGLTTAEVSWILGVNPGAAVVTRGGITATRTARNCWRLESAS